MGLETILIFLTILYALKVSIFLVGLRRINGFPSSDQAPFVSVIIAARNEEQHLAACLFSVLNQTHARENFEVIVVDDRSTDSTDQICQTFAEQYQNISSIIAKEDPVLRGKTNALAQGIEKSRGEVILITDADCIVPPTWIEQTARLYTPEVGIVGGMTLQHSRNSFEAMQSLDWAYLLGLAASTVALGVPLSSIGNNFSFRKAAYEQVGGYRKIPFSVTEDYMLFQTILATRSWKCRYPIDVNLLVMSQPCNNFRELLRQKRRWGKGGVDMKLSGLLIMAVGFSTHMAILLALVTGSVTAGLTCLLVKSLFDYSFLYRILDKLSRKDLLKYFFPFELYYLLYVVLLPFLVFLGGKVLWKGRAY